MKITKENDSTAMARNIGAAIGIGIVAGLIGTVAMTISQMIEMKIDKREPSDTPLKAVSKTLGVKPSSEEQKATVSSEIHYTYGTAWGIARGLISLTGLKGWPATLLHFAAVYSAELIMLPSLKVAPPVTKEKPKEIAIDVLHHAVYAAATGLAFDALLD